MNGRLPCLTTLALAAATAVAAAQGPLPPTPAVQPPAVEQGPGTQGQGPHTVGDRLVLQAAMQLERRESVAARLRHKVNLDGLELYGVGSYWQQGRGDSLRVRMELQIAGQQSSMLQVSNGRFLWTDVRLPTGRDVTRIDLRQLRSDPLLASGNSEILPGHASWSPMQPELAASTGGLPTLLASLGANFTFLAPQAMRLTFSPPLVEQTTSIPVFAVVGLWKPEKLADLLLSVKKKSADEPQETPLPTRLPREVLLLVGQADLFPYRIEYRRNISTAPGTTVPYQLSDAPMVMLELSDVAFDSPVAASQFDYAPGDTKWDDRTAEHLDRLRSKR
jgi:hypothetical protein